jgi:AraC-like DNA-binding protein
MTGSPIGQRPVPRVMPTDYLAAARGFARFRDVSADIVDVTLVGAPEDFRTQSTMFHLGSAVAVDVTTTPVIYDRSGAHVARTNSDHYMLTMYVTGGCEYTAGRRAVTARAGDVFIVDNRECSRSHVIQSDHGSARALNVMLPRRRFAPLLAAPDAVNGSVISRESTAGRLLREHMLALTHFASGDLITSKTDQRLAQLMHLVARGVGAAGEATDQKVARLALLSSVKRHIEQNLASNVDIAHLCRTFRLSRSAIYRLFESEGGLAAYIQQRRLIRAFTLLIRPQTRHLRVIDIAVDSHFASDATFVRAFHRHFGLPPGELRALAVEEEMQTEPSGAPAARQNLLIRWVQDLK